MYAESLPGGVQIARYPIFPKNLKPDQYRSNVLKSAIEKMAGCLHFEIADWRDDIRYVIETGGISPSQIMQNDKTSDAEGGERDTENNGEGTASDNGSSGGSGRGSARANKSVSGSSSKGADNYQKPADEKNKEHQLTTFHPALRRGEKFLTSYKIFDDVSVWSKKRQHKAMVTISVRLESPEFDRNFWGKSFNVSLERKYGFLKQLRSVDMSYPWEGGGSGSPRESGGGGGSSSSTAAGRNSKDASKKDGMMKKSAAGNTVMRPRTSPSGDSVDDSDPESSGAGNSKIDRTHINTLNRSGRNSTDDNSPRNSDGSNNSPTSARNYLKWQRAEAKENSLFCVGAATLFWEWCGDWDTVGADDDDDGSGNADSAIEIPSVCIPYFGTAFGLRGMRLGELLLMFICEILGETVWSSYEHDVRGKIVEKERSMSRAARKRKGNKEPRSCFQLYVPATSKAQPFWVRCGGKVVSGKNGGEEGGKEDNLALLNNAESENNRGMSSNSKARKKESKEAVSVRGQRNLEAIVQAMHCFSANTTTLLQMDWQGLRSRDINHPVSGNTLSSASFSSRCPALKNLQEKMTDSFLFKAVRKGSPMELGGRLLTEGKVPKCSENGWILLHESVQRDDEASGYALTKFLLQSKADPNKLEMEWRQPALFFAANLDRCDVGRFDCLDNLIWFSDFGASTEFWDNVCFGPLNPALLLRVLYFLPHILPRSSTS